MELEPDRDPVVDRIVGDCLAIRVRLINRVVSAIYDEAFRPLGLRVSQANLLVALAHQGPTQPAHLCRLVRIEKSTLSRDIELMKRHDWVESDPPTGGRNQTIRLTDRGCELLQTLLPAWEQAQVQARECLGDEGVPQIYAIARRLGFG